MNSSNLVKSMKQTLYGTTAKCCFTFSLTIFSGVGRYSELSTDDILTSRLISCISLRTSSYMDAKTCMDAKMKESNHKKKWQPKQ